MIVCCAPSRSMTMLSGSPGDSRMIADASANVVIGWPSTCTMTSPGCRPAAAAGATGSDAAHSVRSASAGMTHSLTLATVVVAVCTPMPDEEDGEQDDREQQVHDRTAEHDDDALPDRELVEDVIVVVARAASRRWRRGRPAPSSRRSRRRRDRRDARPRPRSRSLGRRRVHARHRDVAAERNRLESVLRSRRCGATTGWDRSRSCTARRARRTSSPAPGDRARAARSTRPAPRP